MKNGELHLMILWNHARYKQDEIIKDLRSKFQIIEQIEIKWNLEFVSSNFTRFYGVNLPNRSFKEKECGTGPFLLLILWDNNPVYDFRKTSHGIERVNIKMFDNKMLYRSWTNGGHKVHGSTTISETNHDLTLLLGISYEDYLKKADFSVCKTSILNRDLEGCSRWKSKEQLFYVLNNTIKYVVLRGSDVLEDANMNDEHGDIDFLVEGYENFIFISNTKQIWDYPMRPRSELTIGGKSYILDLWDTRYSYYSKAWQQNMLEDRVLINGIYELNQENNFYSIIYHCIYNKRSIANDYKLKLIEEYEKRHFDVTYGQLTENNLSVTLYYVLVDYMKSKGYKFTVVPEDKHLFTNKRISALETAIENIKNTQFFEKLVPLNILDDTVSGYLYFYAIYNGRAVFIKYGGIGNSAYNEYEFTKRLFEHNHSHFLNPLLLYDNNKIPILLFDYIEGVSLEHWIKEGNNENASKQLFEIISILKKAKVIHRDIRPENFIVVRNTLILLDFQFAMNLEKPIELHSVKQDYFLACGIGNINYRSSAIAWNDVDSYKKMCKRLCIKSYEIKRGKSVYMPLNFLIRRLYEYNRNRVYGFIVKLRKRYNHNSNS